MIHERVGRTEERRLLRDSVWNLLGKGIPLIAVVVFLPYLLRKLGNERFGLLSLILAMLAYANALNLGLGKAITRTASRAIGEANTEEVIAPVTWAAAGAQFILGAAGGCVLFFVAQPLVRIMHFSTENVEEARAALQLLGFVVPIILVTTTFRGLLEGAQRFDLVNLVVAPIGVIDFSLPALAIFLDRGMVAIVTLLLASRLTALLAFFCFCWKVFPELHARRHTTLRHFRLLLSFGGWVAISDLVFPMLGYLDRFLVGALGGIAAVPVYVIPNEIITRLWLVPASLVTAVFPAASAIEGKRDPGRLEALYGRGMRYMVLGVPPMAALLTLFSRDIVSIWISPSVAAEAEPLIAIFAIGLVVNSLAMIGSALVQGQGFPRLRAQLHLIEVPAYLLVAWFLIPRGGAVGAACAWTIRMLLTALLVHLVVHRRLSLRAQVLREHGVYFAAFAPLFFLAGSLLLGPHLSQLGRIVFGVVGVAAVLVAWYASETKDKARAGVTDQSVLERV